MKNLQIVAATLATAGVGLGSLMIIPQTVNQADCPSGWYWDDERQNCLPPWPAKGSTQWMPYRRRHAFHRHNLRQLAPFQQAAFVRHVD